MKLSLSIIFSSDGASFVFAMNLGNTDQQSILAICECINEYGLHEAHIYTSSTQISLNIFVYESIVCVSVFKCERPCQSAWFSVQS